MKMEMSGMETVLIIDDDPKVRLSIADILQYKGYKTIEAGNGSEGLELFNRYQIHVVLLDIVMPGKSGLEILKEMIEEKPHIPTIMISGHGTIEIAIKATKLGAYDFIEKPIDADRLLITLKNAIKSGQLLAEKERLSSELQRKYSFIGQSKAVKILFNTIDQISPTTAKVLITGETGVGKELVAYAIHRNSRRADNPFVKVNCAAIPKDLIESELFGYKRGAFTGAITDRKGKFITAAGGTIFLDEIGEMELQAQAKLLQVLQDNVITPIGADQSYTIDVRVIAATNKDLSKEIKEGRFREDLFYRLNVAHIHIPPLRERREDIPLLANHYLKYFCEEYNKELMNITDASMNLLCDYDWPGNVRELRNTIEKIVIFNQNKNDVLPGIIVEALNMQDRFGNDNGTKKLAEAKLEFEKNYILKTLTKYDWRIQKTAAALGIDRTNLFKKMQRHRIKKASLR